MTSFLCGSQFLKARKIKNSVTAYILLVVAMFGLTLFLLFNSTGQSQSLSSLPNFIPRNGDFENLPVEGSVRWARKRWSHVIYVYGQMDIQEYWNSNDPDWEYFIGNSKTFSHNWLDPTYEWKAVEMLQVRVFHEKETPFHCSLYASKTGNLSR